MAEQGNSITINTLAWAYFTAHVFIYLSTYLMTYNSLNIYCVSSAVLLSLESGIIQLNPYGEQGAVHSYVYRFRYRREILVVNKQLQCCHQLYSSLGSQEITVTILEVVQNGKSRTTENKQLRGILGKYGSTEVKGTVCLKRKGWSTVLIK